MDQILYLVPVLAVVGLLVMLFQYAWVRKQDKGDARMAEIAQHIHEGALAFLKAEYRILAIFVVIERLTAWIERNDPDSDDDSDSGGAL